MLDKNGFDVKADEHEVINGEDVSKLFERDGVNKDHTKWFFPDFKKTIEKHKSQGKNKGVKFKLTFKRPILIRGYAIVSGNDEPDRDPKDWTLWGYNFLKPDENA